MRPQLRQPSPADVEAAAAVRAQAFAVPEDDAPRWIARVDADHMVVAVVDGEVVGSLGVLPFAQWFGGRSVPSGGIATVVVRPEHRGRGVAAAMLEWALAHHREHGLAVSALHPATLRPYRRAGWEIAGELPRLAIPTASLSRLPRGEPERLRRLDPRLHLPMIRDCYDATAPHQPGWVDRTDARWSLHQSGWVHDLTFVYAVASDEDDDVLDGYVVYRIAARPHGGHDLVVDELVTRTPEARETIWHLLGANSMQVDEVQTVGAVDEASIALTVGEQDVRVRPTLRWMARVVDARAAIAARGFPTAVSAEVHLHLDDPLVRECSGDWVLTVDRGRGTLEPGGMGTVRLGARGFASLYTGWVMPRDLVAAGLLHHGTSDDLDALGACFAGRRPSISDAF